MGPCRDIEFFGPKFSYLSSNLSTNACQGCCATIRSSTMVRVMFKLEKWLLCECVVGLLKDPFAVLIVGVGFDFQNL